MVFSSRGGENRGKGKGNTFGSIYFTLFLSLFFLQDIAILQFGISLDLVEQSFQLFERKFAKEVSKEFWIGEMYFVYWNFIIISTPVFL